MEEAAFSSYTSSMQRLMAKLFINCKDHQWLQMSGLGAAASPRTVKMVGERYLDLATIMYALEPAHQCTGSVANVCGDTWGSYLVDGIHKVVSMIRSSGVQHGRVVMYSTSHHLFGGDLDPFAIMNPACQVPLVIFNSDLRKKKNCSPVVHSNISISSNYIPSHLFVLSPHFPFRSSPGFAFHFSRLLIFLVPVLVLVLVLVLVPVLVLVLFLFLFLVLVLVLVFVLVVQMMENKINDLCDAILQLLSFAPNMRVDLVVVDLIPGDNHSYSLSITGYYLKYMHPIGVLTCTWACQYELPILINPPLPLPLPTLLAPLVSSPASANTHTHNNTNLALSLMLKRRLGGTVHFLTQGNTPLYYEEELRRLMSHQVNPFYTTHTLHITPIISIHIPLYLNINISHNPITKTPITITTLITAYLSQPNRTPPSPPYPPTPSRLL